MADMGIRSWVRNRSVATKLGAIAVVAAATTAALASVGVHGVSSASARAEELQVVNGLTRQALEADMAHDAVRGDVLRALLAVEDDGVDPDGQAAKDDLAVHEEILREAIHTFQGAGMSPAVRTAAQGVAPVVERYLDLATQTLDAALDGEREPVTYADFQKAFGEVEEELPAVSDALATTAGDASAAVGTYKASAMRELALAGLAGLLLLAAICWLVGRGILRPLRAVSAVLHGLAAGDLSQTARVSSTDEVGRMARDLNQAVDSVRGTIESLAASASSVAGTAEQFIGVAESIAASAEEAGGRADEATGASAEIARYVGTLAAGAEQMIGSIGEISHNANEALRVADDAVAMADETNARMARLGESSTEIGNVVKVITSIAEQTNLLALNATIEAARAGDAGKGFAVVAGEVKDLAQETARATDDIARRVEAIQADTTLAVDAIGKISAIIARVNDYQVTIASAVEEQTASTGESSRTVSDVARRSADISRTISGIAEVGARNTAQACSSQSTARELAEMAEEMAELVGRFRL
jgi:methyl-accepting chemotaxis protein